jgi:hypothetical protein
MRRPFFIAADASDPRSPQFLYLSPMDDSERERELRRNEARLTDLRGYL